MAECPICIINRRGFMAKAVGGALALGAAVRLSGSTPVTAQQGPVQEQLAMGHTDYSEFIGGPADSYTIKITLAPGAVIDWHLHPGPVFATVAAGTLTITYDLTGCKVDFAAGSLSYVPNGTIHQDRNDGAVPLVLYGTFIVPAGSPLRVPVDAPAKSTSACVQSVPAPATGR